MASWSNSQKMKFLNICLMPLLSIGLVTVSTATTTTTTTTANHQEALLQWLLSKQRAYFNDKLKFQPLFPGGPNGMFTTQFMAKNETVMIIPLECLLTSDLGDGASMDICDTTRHLVQEYQTLQNTGKSQFAPYVHYIFDQKQFNKVPAAWSEAGKTLLKTVIGDELHPQDVDEMDYWDLCGTPEERDQAEHEHTVQLYRDACRAVVTRSWKDVMILVFDMVNHRNGHYHNVDQLTTAHGEDDVIIVALRDIEPGEQLYTSYNECHDEDCDGIAYTYILPQIMRDYGFVEEYPHRWWFSEKPDDEDSFILIELEQDPTTGELQLIWLSDEPKQNGLSYLRGHWKRQQAIHDELVEQANQLEATYERDTILDFHRALMVALEMAIDGTGLRESKIHKPEEECDIQANGSADCKMSTQKHRYDELLSEQQQPTENEKKIKDTEDYFLCSRDSDDFEIFDETKSFYQTITFEYNEDIDDTCLYLSSYLQVCQTWRSHYHESMVHVPATFLDKVERVIILGGGDNMMMHEVLKYGDSLELVLDMELDPQVVRSSFKNLGTQPHFDNPKVQWWFGDAAKSLSLLPPDYFGTFDLVIVDLQTNVVEILEVTPTRTIMDAAMDLLKPEGIIVRNEDFYPRQNVAFAKYEVDLEYLDVPMMCQLSFTMGSKTVDFLTKKPKDHGIVNSLYFHFEKERFDNWFNYRNNKDKEKKETSSEGIDLSVPTSKNGVRMIIEVDNAVFDVSKLGVKKARKSISTALLQVGFAEMSVTVAPENRTFYLFKEGYLLAQFWLKQKYVGFEIKLWNKLDKLESVKTALIDVVQGEVSALFRIVTGGMSGLEETKNTQEESGKDADTKQSSDHVERQIESFPEDAAGMIFREAISSFIPSAVNTILAVLCPAKADRCKSLESLYEHNVHLTRSVIPIYSCPGLTEETMFECERKSEEGLLADTKEAGGKIHGIIIDGDAPKAMGQIFHYLLSDKSNRLLLLEKEYIVIYTSQELSPSWQRTLLERFQTQFDIFSPALRSQVFFNRTEGSLEMGIFSCGKPDFYTALLNMLESVEKKTSVAWEVRKVEDGVIGYIADFYPSVFPSDASYEKEDSLEQWLNQSPVGHQTIFQYNIQAPFSRLTVGETVLTEFHRHIWKGRWLPSRVLEETEGGKYMVDLEGTSEIEVERGSIRKLDFTSEVEVMDQVLIQGNTHWSQGSIIDKSPDGRTFKVRRFDKEGEVVMVRRENLVPRMESNEATKEVPSLMTVNLSETISNTLKSIHLFVNEEDFHVFWGIGSGCVIVVFWDGGNGVFTWDGNTHLEVSLFTVQENKELREAFARAITQEIPSLMLESRNDYPRGFGRVVSFRSDLETDPPWVVEEEMDSEDDE